MQVSQEYASRRRWGVSNGRAIWLAAASVAAYLTLWTGSVMAIRGKAGLDLTEPLFIFAIMGVGFSALAWFVTRRLEPLRFAVRKPGIECTVLAIWLVVVGWFLTWGIDALKSRVAREPWQMSAMLGAKLAIFVVFPLTLFCAFGKYKIRELLPVSFNTKHLTAALWMSLALLLFETVFGRGISEIRHSRLPLRSIAVGLPFAFAWLLLEVGLVEEFFFRVLLQSRLSALLRSEVAGIVLMALLFGLAHAPGLYFRSALTLEGLGVHPSLLVAASYSIAIISVAGFFLGVLWARTRNILVVILVHAATDLIPSLVHFLKAW